MVMIEHLGGSPAESFVRVADALFAAQDAFQTTATRNITQDQLFVKIFAPVANSLGVRYAVYCYIISHPHSICAWVVIVI